MSTPGMLRALSVVCGGVTAFAMSAQAQAPSSTPDAKDREQADKHVIVGPHRWYANAESEPEWRYTEMRGDLIEKLGANTPIEALRELPVFVGKTATENDSNGGNGSASISLYGLGPSNVLTLINGRRAFS